MTANIYDHHTAAFSSVSAYVILDKDTDDKGNPVRFATVAFKFPKSGMSVIAYVHVLGQPMVRGVARGGGYDRQSAAVAHAVSKMPFGNDAGDDWKSGNDTVHSFIAVLSKDNGSTWDRKLTDAGFAVLQAV